MKLNYTSLQHAVDAGRGRAPASCRSSGRSRCSRCTASSRRSPGRSPRARPAARLGYVQTEGGALPGGHSRPCACCASAGCSPATSRPARPSAARARRSRPPARCTTACARSAGTRRCAARAPGSSARARRSGTAAWSALDSAHVALALGCPTLLVARMSSGDRRARHRGISHHTLTVLDLLLEPVTVALPAGHALARRRRPARRPRRGVRRRVPSAPRARRSRSSARCASRRHDWRRARGRPARLSPPAACRPRRWAAALAEDPLFFGAALAGGHGARRAPWRAQPRGEAGRSRRSRRGGSEPRPRASRRSAARPSTRAGSWTCASSASATPTATRSRARSCATAAPWRSSPTTSAVVWLVRQPREAVGEPDLLEIPAGRLDVDGRGAARRPPSASWPRRSACGARTWEPIAHLLHRAPASPTSACTCSRPPACTSADADSDEQERIEIVRWPLSRARRGDRGVPRRKDADRPATGWPAAERLIAAPRSPAAGAKLGHDAPLPRARPTPRRQRSSR